jgi:Domain of unknown function (DUF4156)
MRKLFLIVPVVLLSACTWGIKLDENGQNVRTAWSGDVSQCHELGKVTVSVLSRVGPIDRNDLTVRDELEVLARNEAATMHGDTIKPLADPSAGAQPWGVYTCGKGPLPSGQQAPRPAPQDSAPPSSGFETVPIKN